MDEREFEQVAAEEWDAVPERFKRELENVALLVEDAPDAATLTEEGLEDGDTLLGLYRGIPRTERGEGYGVGPTLPDTITLYRLPILEEALESADSPSDAIRAVVRETIWHEIGHYFGHGDEALHEREDEGTNRF